MNDDNPTQVTAEEFKQGLISALAEAERNFEMAQNQLWFMRGQLDLFSKLHPELFRRESGPSLAKVDLPGKGNVDGKA